MGVEEEVGTMRIVVLGLRGFPNVQGGVEKHCENLYPRLVKLGCEVIVLGRQPYVGDQEYSYQGVTIKPLACPKNKFLEAFMHTRQGVREAKRLSPDILHIHAVGPSLFVPLVKALGMKVVMTHHGPDYERKKWNWFAKMVLRFAESQGCRNADEIICISKQIAQDVKVKFGRDAAVIPNGVVMPEGVATDEALRKYGLEKGKYVLAVGRFVPEKGFGELIEAWRGLEPRGSWKLVIVGDADHEDEYSRKLKEKAKGVPGVVLTGRLTGTPLQELYACAGLFVLPSYYEGLPIVLLEAMSYGLSCVVSDISANREVPLAPERYFKAGDVEGMAKKILEFIDKPMGEDEKSLQLVVIRENYDWEKVAKSTLDVYLSKGNR